ncbi:MAG: hypothetical protein U5L96_02035 [Owenweeksia sp.]|nr:hypothetical protein [Owenweeksia sp.]
MNLRLVAAFLLSTIVSSCNFGLEPIPTKSMVVTATAYNSLAYQTQGDPTLTAWGDTLKPGMKAIAVSRDLIDSGLTHNTWVYIEELQDTFLVKDKMNRRWTRKIDIYLGNYVDSARQWGKRPVNITWPGPASEID